ncbi:MAG: PAS-domain containing protein [Paracoccaceae bacterium]
MALVSDYVQSFLAANLGERLAVVALVFGLAILLRQLLRARQPDSAAPALAAMGERLAMTERRAEAAEHEARQLANLLNALPGPVWQRDANGALLWANSRFHNLDSDDITALEAAAPGDFITPNAAQPQVFERGGGPVIGGQDVESPQFALPADRLFATQSALKRFVETLTQTFAHLPIGLAIFDADRRLGVFNPALADLLGLDPAWLAARPRFRGVMEKLRDTGHMSQGAEFQTWLEQLQSIEHSAENAGYSDTWVLPGGASLRVTGRPHIDGALAFVFEDMTHISQAETRHRSEVALGQAILDRMSESVAVFDTTGALLFANQSFDTLWQMETTTTLAGPAIHTLIAQWQRYGGAAQDWQRLAAQISGSDDRQGGQMVLHHPEHGALLCLWHTMPEGSTLVYFKPPPQPAHWPKLIAPLARALSSGHLLEDDLPILGEGVGDKAELLALRSAVLGLIAQADAPASYREELAS